MTKRWWKALASNVAKHDCDVELTVYSKLNPKNSLGAIYSYLTSLPLSTICGEIRHF
jgi:hypothetical protein